MAQNLGLSVGATNISAVGPRRMSATRRSVLTLYRHRPPDVGVPTENPNIDPRGLVITDFVDRVGDPVGIVAGDGSVHRADGLVAEALCALMHAIIDGLSPAQPPTIAVPAHWSAPVVGALRRALAALPEWPNATDSLPVISDVAAAFTALAHGPGLPAHGVIALCDFGGTGTSVTLADAGNGFRPIGPTVRHTDFSGELIDHALLKHVLADLPADAAVTAGLGSLSRLRANCRAAKERLSATAVTALTADVPRFRGTVRLTRAELEDEIRRPLADLMGVVHETLARNQVWLSDLAAVASVGGGANVPMITTTLSEHLRVPVITTPRPELAAAAGAALWAVRGGADHRATTVFAPAPAPGYGPPADAAGAPTCAAVAAPTCAAAAAPTCSAAAAPTRAAAAAPVSGPAFAPPARPVPALAWSQEEQLPELDLSNARPELQFHPSDRVRSVERARVWYRRPLLAAAGTAAAIALMAGAVVLHEDSRSLAATKSTTTVAPSPAAPSGPAPAAADPGQPGQPPAVVQAPVPLAQSRPIQQQADQQPAAVGPASVVAPAPVIAPPPAVAPAPVIAPPPAVAPAPVIAPPPAVAPAPVISPALAPQGPPNPPTPPIATPIPAPPTSPPAVATTTPPPPTTTTTEPPTTMRQPPPTTPTQPPGTTRQPAPTKQPAPTATDAPTQSSELPSTTPSVPPGSGGRH